MGFPPPAPPLVAYASPQPRFSTLTPNDRLVVAHPSPTTGTPLRASSSPTLTNQYPSYAHLQQSSRQYTAAPPLPPPPRYTARQCLFCLRTLWSYEFAPHPPTERCRHANAMCVYCLHESVKGMWGSGEEKGRVVCEVCGEEMSREEVRRGVLVWREVGRHGEERGRDRVGNRHV
jgi:hypothetical protein